MCLFEPFQFFLVAFQLFFSNFQTVLESLFVFKCFLFFEGNTFFHKDFRQSIDHLGNHDRIVMDHSDLHQSSTPAKIDLNMRLKPGHRRAKIVHDKCNFFPKLEEFRLHLETESVDRKYGILNCRNRALSNLFLVLFIHTQTIKSKKRIFYS